MPRVPVSHMEERRSQIVAAALRCFRAKGIAETRMRDIFAASGLSAGAVYNHFPSKRALIAHLAAASERKWAEILAAAAAPDRDAPADALKDLVGGMIDGLDDPDVVTEIAADVGVWAYAINQEELRTACRRVFRTIAAGFDRILAGETGEASGVGVHLLAQLQGLGLQAAMGVRPDLAREKALAGAVIDRFVAEVGP